MIETWSSIPPRISSASFRRIKRLSNLNALKATLWLIFAVFAVVGGIYVPQWTAKALLFSSGVSAWGWELLPSLLIGPPLALGVYALLFCWMKEQAFASRCVMNALGGVLISTGAVVLVLAIAK